MLKSEIFSEDTELSTDQTHLIDLRMKSAADKKVSSKGAPN